MQWHSVNMFGKSDASTSTEEIKTRGLCMYYFAAPLGVLSAEPPAALSPVSMWTPAAAGRPRYDLGAAALHRRPVPLRPSSPLLSSEWLSSGSSARRVPYHTILPPLRLPTPRYSADDSDDFWPDSILPARVWLPPLLLPPPAIEFTEDQASDRSRRSSHLGAGRGKKRIKGVRKRRRRLTDMQHALANLTRRRIRGTGRSSLSCSGALRVALTELRAAWIPPRTSSFMSTWSRCERETVFERDSARSSVASTMSRRALWADLPPRPGASPGLLRRRYSAPETVMRKYRLEQQREAWCSSVGSRSPASSPCRGRAAGAGAAPLRRAAVLRRAAACSLHASPARAQQPQQTHQPYPAHQPYHAHQPYPAHQTHQPHQPHPAHRPHYDVLEVVVTEAFCPQSLPPESPAQSSPHPAFDIDAYVSSVLVESLNSLSDRLESAVAAERMSIVEKEIKVRLHNAGVNTIVHLSPTSNNQIIFGNEELCNREERDECNNVCSPIAVLEIDVSSPAHSPPPAAPAAPAPPADRAVLRQLQRLFRDTPPPSPPAPRCPPARSPPVPSSPPSIPSSTSCPASLQQTIRSMEPQVSRPTSPTASLVDSLDDPTSPRRDLLALLPPPAPASPAPPPAPAPPAPAPPARAFFVQILEDARSAPRAAVADLMPPRLRRRLQRRQRRRVQRAEVRRRTPAPADASGPGAPLRASLAPALFDALLQELIASAVREELLSLRRATPGAARHATERRAALRGRLSLQPAPPPGPARRRYQKSELLEGSKRVEILEILEYDASSDSSPAGSPPGDSLSGGEPQRARPSRIPVPVTPVTTAARGVAASRLRRRLQDALGGSPTPAPRPRSGSLRCRPAFAAIPEERPAPTARSAGTSPPPRLAAHKATMTSPARQPTPPAPPAPPPRCAPPPPRCIPAPPRASPAPPPADSVRAGADGSSSGSSEPGAPVAPRRRRRRQTRDAGPTKAQVATEVQAMPPVRSTKEDKPSPTAWSVTVGGERAPQELQLRLRFPTPGPAATSAQNRPTQQSCTPDTSTTRTDVMCSCHHCRVPSRALPPAPVPQHQNHSRICPSRNGSDHVARLPLLRRDSLAGQVKTRRARSPRSWRPSDAPVLTVSASALQVVGNAVRPTCRPRRR